jgi:hypothetical protein
MTTSARALQWILVAVLFFTNVQALPYVVSATPPFNSTVSNLPNVTIVFDTPVTGDNCGVAGVVCVPASGSTFDLGTTPVVCTVTDNSGNTNSCTFTVTVSAGACTCPDLTGTWSNLVQTCKTKNAGPQCKVKGRLLVSNIGCVDASTSFLRYYLSDDSEYDAGDTLLKQQATGTVKVGKIKKRTLSAQLPANVSGTGKFIIAVLDADHTLAECDETNNAIVLGPIP